MGVFANNDVSRYYSPKERKYSAAEAETRPDAGVDELPPVLARPPWRPRRHLPRAVLDRRAPTRLSTLEWLPGEQQQWAETPLEAEGAAGHGDTIRAAAAAYHPEAPTAVAFVLHVDPLLLLPKRIPRLRRWIAVDRLPKILLARSDVVLPTSATADLCTMLMMRSPGNDYAGVRAVTAATEQTTLARFARGLLDQWGQAGYPQKDDWVLSSQGLLGDRHTVFYPQSLTAQWSRMAEAGRAASATLHTSGRLGQLDYARYDHRG